MTAVQPRAEVAAATSTTARLADLTEALAAATAGPGVPAAGATGPDEERLAAAVVHGHDVLRRAGERRALAGAHTVVALAGATGSGKSSVFNAVVGEPRVAVGVRRPTTSDPVAGVVGEPSEAAALLDWLEVGRRHALDLEGLDGLVLVDLPDVDSVVSDHARTVDRLAATVDVLVWVLDPQKYADAVVHQRYLRPMATHADVTVVVLNQADLLGPAERTEVAADLRRLLADDGLAGVRPLLTSTVTGEGVAELRGVLAEIAAARTAAEARLAADARAAARGLLAAAGSPAPHGVTDADRDALAVVLAEAAGVDVVVDAVARSHRMAARAATGWPVTRWLGRLRPDPLRRLGLARDVVDPALVRSAVPRPTAVLRARVDEAVRELARTAAGPAAEPWRGRIRTAATAGAPALDDALDQALVATRLDPARRPRWWRAAGALQWLLVAAAATGALWLAAVSLAGYLQLPELPVPRLGVLPWPSALLLGGVLGGLVVAAVGAVGGRLGGRRRSAKARRRLREAVGRVAEDVVVAPVVEQVARCVSMNRAARRAAS